MMFRLTTTLLCAALALSGCVSSGTYQLKETLLEMRGVGRQPGSESSTRPSETKSAPVAAKPVPVAPAKPVTAVPAVEKAKPAQALEDKPRPVVTDKTLPAPAPVEKSRPVAAGSETPRQQEPAPAEDGSVTIHIPGEEPISLPSAEVK
jgi:hypothetical protein